MRRDAQTCIVWRAVHCDVSSRPARVLPKAKSTNFLLKSKLEALSLKFTTNGHDFCIVSFCDCASVLPGCNMGKANAELCELHDSFCMHVCTAVMAVRSTALVLCQLHVHCSICRVLQQRV